MSELDFEFEHQGRVVRPGQLLHVHPSAWWKAGPSGKVERYYGDTVILRADNGAVPNVELSLLSWEPHPHTVAMEELNRAGFGHPTNRDVAVWQAALASQPKPAPVLLTYDEFIAAEERDLNMTQPEETTFGPLPETTLAEVRNDKTRERELSDHGSAYYGSNWYMVRKLYTADQMREYAAQEVAAYLNKLTTVTK